MSEQNNSTGSFSLEQWSKVKPALFDRTEIFNAEIEPHLKVVQELCNEHGISFFSIAGVSNDADDCGYAAAFCFGGSIENLTLEPLLLSMLAEASNRIERLMIIQAVTDGWIKKLELEKAATEAVGDEQ